MGKVNMSTRITNIVQAYGNQVKTNIIHILNIFGSLTTIEISNKLRKSKTTILRNIEELVKLKIVTFEEEGGLPGKYPRRKYHIVKGDFSVRGQNYRDMIIHDPEYILEYNQYRQGLYTLLNSITNSSVNYLKRLKLEFEKEIGNPDAILELQKDNLGSIQFKYLTRTELEIKQGINNEKNSIQKEKSTKRPYLEITMLLPIERIVEMDTRKDWKKNGTLWFY